MFHLFKFEHLLIIGTLVELNKLNFLYLYIFIFIVDFLVFIMPLEFTKSQKGKTLILFIGFSNRKEICIKYKTYLRYNDIKNCPGKVYSSNGQHIFRYFMILVFKFITNLKNLICSKIFRQCFVYA